MRLCERCGEREALHTPTIVTRDGQMVSEQYLCTICQYLVMRAARAGNMDVQFPDEQLPTEPDTPPGPS
jgi:hypothetical protein